MTDYISLLATHPQLLAHAKKLEVKELRSFLWKNILRLYNLNDADTIEVSAYYSSAEFLTALEDALRGIFPHVDKISVEKIPNKTIFVCEPSDGDDIIIAASWFAEEPDPAS
jgi:predicted butyrate kinase (DUF1464 family)